jgi:hypothetical protein
MTDRLQIQALLFALLALSIAAAATRKMLGDGRAASAFASEVALFYFASSLFTCCSTRSVEERWHNRILPQSRGRP